MSNVQKPHSEKADKTKAYNFERCDQEMLESSLKARQNNKDQEKNTMCNSYYGLVSVKNTKQ